VAGLGWGEKYQGVSVQAKMKLVPDLRSVQGVGLRAQRALSILAYLLELRPSLTFREQRTPSHTPQWDTLQCVRLWVLLRRVSVYIALLQLSCSPNSLLFLHHFSGFRHWCSYSCCISWCLFSQVLVCMARLGTVHFLC